VIPPFGRACWLGRLGGQGSGVDRIWQILKTNGIDLAPRRAGSTWSQFLSSPAEAILACDFFSVDLPGGTHVYVLTVIEHARRARRSQRPNAVRRSERPELGVCSLASAGG
jgi:putative transposase